MGRIGVPDGIPEAFFNLLDFGIWLHLECGRSLRGVFGQLGLISHSFATSEENFLVAPSFRVVSQFGGLSLSNIRQE